MPIPEPPGDFELYESDIKGKKSTLQAIVEESRWIADFAALYALHAAATTVLFLLVRRAYETGLEIRLASGILAASIMCLLLWSPIWTAILTSTEAVLLKFRQFTFVPYNIQDRHLLLHSLWRSLLFTIQVAASLGAGYFFSELIKNSSLPQ